MEPKQNPVKQKRIIYLDILKVIGLFCIILAHVSPPGIIFQLRNFDVVLLVLISAFLGLVTYKKGFLKYIIKRFNRLIVPTWVFVFIFAIISLPLGYFDFNLQNFVETITLTDYGIGYLWVIRIYFIVALLIPLHVFLQTKIKKENRLVLVSLLAFIIYEALCYIGLFDNYFSQYFFAYIPPCFLLISLSKYLFSKNNKSRIIIATISLIIFITIGYYLYQRTGHLQPTQTLKYPFRAYYLSYGVFCSAILIMIFKNIKYHKNILFKAIEFISQHSLWFYLWHILAIYLLKDFDTVWYFKLLLIIIIASCITYIQSLIINKIKTKQNSRIIKIFEG